MFNVFPSSCLCYCTCRNRQRSARRRRRPASGDAFRTCSEFFLLPVSFFNVASEGVGAVRSLQKNKRFPSASCCSRKRARRVKEHPAKRGFREPKRCSNSEASRPRVSNKTIITHNGGRRCEICHRKPINFVPDAKSFLKRGTFCENRCALLQSRQVSCIMLVKFSCSRRKNAHLHFSPPR
jgi:hypothetical protein